MKNRSPVLEYWAARTARNKKTKWSFRFRTPEGDLLLESTRTFDSKTQAEQGFVSLIKAVASNQYKVDYIEEDKAGRARLPARRDCGWKGHRRNRLADQI